MSEKPSINDIICQTLDNIFRKSRAGYTYGALWLELKESKPFSEYYGSIVEKYKIEKIEYISKNFISYLAYVIENFFEKSGKVEIYEDMEDKELTFFMPVPEKCT